MENVDPQDIINFWIPGDYLPEGRHEPCGCYETYGYHNCDSSTLEQKWDITLEIARSDKRYEVIYKAIKQDGFKVPLGAKRMHEGEIVLVDGHHRVAVALDLGLLEIPVFVGTHDADVFDLKAMDSGYWNGRGLDSPFVD